MRGLLIALDHDLRMAMLRILAHSHCKRQGFGRCLRPTLEALRKAYIRLVLMRLVSRLAMTRATLQVER